MKIKSVLSQSAFWQINKSLAQKVGLESALLLSDLIDRESYFEGRGMLIDINGEGYFFVTSKQISDATTLSYRKQKKCITTLEDEGMIKTFLRGVPAKLHFTICESKIWQSVNTSISETLKLDLAKTQYKSERNAKTINNNKEIIIDNNNKAIDKKEIKQSKQASNVLVVEDSIVIKKERKKAEKVPSDLDAAIKYFYERNSTTEEAEKFYDHYCSNGWVVGKARTPMKDWKASVRNWLRNAPSFKNHNNDPKMSDAQIRSNQMRLIGDSSHRKEEFDAMDRMFEAGLGGVPSKQVVTHQPKQHALPDGGVGIEAANAFLAKRKEREEAKKLEDNQMELLR